MTKSHLITVLVLLSAICSGLSEPVSAIQSTENLHIHVISGSEEYESESSLQSLKEILTERYDFIEITFSLGQDAGNDLPNIHLLRDADLLVVFTRRMTLPESQLYLIRQHFEAEKPVIGIRTASHAFQGFLEMDSLIFGGNYSGHGDEESVELSFNNQPGHHPLLEGVQPWTRPGKLYQNPNLESDVQKLIFGTGLESNLHEPVAWTHIYGSAGRAFYTSLGIPSDFENENFQQLLINAISWTTGHEL